jgi:peroxiredoxin
MQRLPCARPSGAPREGKVARVFEDVAPATHADDVLAALKALP